MIKESGIDLLSLRATRLEETEEIHYEAVTTTVKKALRLHRDIQAKDGHWPADFGGPLFITPALVSL